MSEGTDTAGSRSGGIPRYRQWTGWILFSQGFRPFFLGAGVSALVLLAMWVLTVRGMLELPTGFAPVHWHAHEMIFGMLGAAVAGFLLTAVPNWTGRMPLQGWPLIVLFGVWLAGRIVMALGGQFGMELAAIVDGSFLFLLLYVVLREIVTGRNWRNLPVGLALGLLALANVFSHLEALGVVETYQFGFRLGIAVVAALIALIGGRIVPSFTGNWLAKQGVEKRPSSFNRFDGVVLVLTVAALGFWVAAPDAAVSGAMMLAAGIGNFIRVARWRGLHTVSEPLVWSLHVGYAWLPLGFLLTGLAPLTDVVTPTAGLHALTAGAMGGMILAVMTRATLGHTGRALRADGATTLIYVLGFLAAAARVVTAFSTEHYESLLVLSGILWCAAFVLFSVRYGRILLTR